MSAQYTQNLLQLSLKCHPVHPKVMVDFKFDAIQVSFHRELPEVGLVKKVNWKFVLVGEYIGGWSSAYQPYI